jgi:hypothetical protein
MPQEGNSQFQSNSKMTPKPGKNNRDDIREEISDYLFKYGLK